MATTVTLVRHGAYGLLDNALGGRAPHPLSAEGRAQAARVAAALAGRPIAAVIASPVARAAETAGVIADRLGLRVALDPDFAEIDFAGWTGQSFAALAEEEAWSAWNRFRSTAGVPGGETMLAAQARAMAGISRLAAAHPEGEVVVVSHADIIKSVLMHLLGSPLDLMHRLSIGPGSTSRLVLHRDDAAILAINLPP